MTSERWLSVEQATARLGIADQRVTKALREGRLCGVRHGNSWRVVVDDGDQLLYRADRVTSAWRQPTVRVIGDLGAVWPPEATQQLSDLPDRLMLVDDDATDRERQLAGMVEELRRDREFDRIAARTREEEAEAEIERLRRQLDEERRRRELGVRSALLGLAALIPAGDADELRALGLPASQ